MNLNKIFFAGNLTSEPELRQAGKTNVCTFSVASNRSYTVNGEQKEDTCFVGVTVWGKQAESCAKYLAKGRGVLIEGRLTYQTWTNENGDKRSKHEITAEHVTFLGGSNGGNADA